jgi:Tfp pilus assembly protein PilF
MPWRSCWLQPFSLAAAEARGLCLSKSADDYFTSGDYDKAKIEYLNVLRVDPQDVTAVERLGTIWYEQGAPSRGTIFVANARFGS